MSPCLVKRARESESTSRQYAHGCTKGAKTSPFTLLTEPLRGLARSADRLFTPSWRNTVAPALAY